MGALGPGLHEAAVALGDGRRAPAKVGYAVLGAALRVGVLLVLALLVVFQLTPAERKERRLHRRPLVNFVARRDCRVHSDWTPLTARGLPPAEMLHGVRRSVLAALRSRTGFKRERRRWG